MQGIDARRGQWSSTSGTLRIQKRRNGSEQHMQREQFELAKDSPIRQAKRSSQNSAAPM